MRKSHCGPLLVFMVIVVLATLVDEQAEAFNTSAYWSSTSQIKYSIPANLDTELSFPGFPAVTGSTAAIDAAATRWSQATVIDLVKDSASVNEVSARNFVTNPPCGATDATAGITCLSYNGQIAGALSSAKIYLNKSGTYTWNTSDQVSYTAPKKRDIQRTTTHEFGHMLGLDHMPNGPATMNESMRVLDEDDKQGITQIYGPYTGFDGGRAQGIPDYFTYSARVSGYGSEEPNPRLYIVGAENGVTPKYSTGMLRFDGRSVAGTAYAYMKLFSTDKDIGTIKEGFKIPTGAKLTWCQYNVTQFPMSVDAYFSDGTRMSSYPGVIDQYGLRIGPEYHFIITGTWGCYTFDLTPVVGKTVMHWYVAYNNINGGAVSQWLAYFDSIRIIYPGGKP